MKKRQKQILQALRELGGLATTRQIAEKAGLDVNGVSQSLGGCSTWQGKLIAYIGGRGAEARWKLK